VRRAKVALIESARACAAADRPPMPPQDQDRSAEALLRDETERFSAFLVE
jgi:hypothetical protein